MQVTYEQFRVVLQLLHQQAEEILLLTQKLLRLEAELRQAQQVNAVSENHHEPAEVRRTN